MNSERLARNLAASMRRHQTRGLVDDATGVTDVVIHGRVNLQAVAEDMFAASAQQIKPTRKSWSAWFLCEVRQRQNLIRQHRKRERLEALLESGDTEGERAITRLRLRDLEEDRADEF